MTPSELEAIEARERQRQSAVVEQAVHEGGAWDRLLGRFVEWDEHGPARPRLFFELTERPA